MRIYDMMKRRDASALKYYSKGFRPMDVQRLVETFPQSAIQLNKPLSQYSYTKTGGPSDALVFPKTIDETQALVRWIHKHQMPLTVLGNASNLIVRDGGIRGVTMMMTDMNQIDVSDTFVYAQSGARLIEVSQVARNHGLSGLEFACGIPGSIGGAVYMNAGAYGGEISDVIHSVTVLTQSGDVQTKTCQEMAFAYRNSYVQATEDVVLDVTFRLKKGDIDLITQKITELTALREAKQPLDLPSCGSVFKRPTGYYTGQLIQEAGLQGTSIGGAQVSKKHAGFIVNTGNATATDYIQLIKYIQSQISKIYEVELEREVRIIGEDCD